MQGYTLLLLSPTRTGLGHGLSRVQQCEIGHRWGPRYRMRSRHSVLLPTQAEAMANVGGVGRLSTRGLIERGRLEHPQISGSA